MLFRSDCYYFLLKAGTLTKDKGFRFVVPNYGRYVADSSMDAVGDNLVFDIDVGNLWWRSSLKGERRRRDTRRYNNRLSNGNGTLSVKSMDVA